MSMWGLPVPAGTGEGRQEFRETLTLVTVGNKNLYMEQSLKQTQQIKVNKMSFIHSCCILHRHWSGS